MFESHFLIGFWWPIDGFFQWKVRFLQVKTTFSGAILVPNRRFFQWKVRFLYKRMVKTTALESFQTLTWVVDLGIVYDHEMLHPILVLFFFVFFLFFLFLKKFLIIFCFFFKNLLLKFFLRFFEKSQGGITPAQGGYYPITTISINCPGNLSLTSENEDRPKPQMGARKIIFYTIKKLQNLSLTSENEDRPKDPQMGARKIIFYTIKMVPKCQCQCKVLSQNGPKIHASARFWIDLIKKVPEFIID